MTVPSIELNRYRHTKSWLVCPPVLSGRFPYHFPQPHKTLFLPREKSWSVGKLCFNGCESLKHKHSLSTWSGVSDGRQPQLIMGLSHSASCFLILDMHIFIVAPKTLLCWTGASANLGRAISSISGI